MERDWGWGEFVLKGWGLGEGVVGLVVRGFWRRQASLSVGGGGAIGQSQTGVLIPASTHYCISSLDILFPYEQ